MTPSGQFEDYFGKSYLRTDGTRYRFKPRRPSPPIPRHRHPTARSQRGTKGLPRSSLSIESVLRGHPEAWWGRWHMRHVSYPPAVPGPNQAPRSFRQNNRTALDDTENRQGPDGDGVRTRSISGSLPASCGRFTDDWANHSAARPPGSREFLRMGKASGVRVMKTKMGIGRRQDV
jgi:hypothetical protein